MEVCQPLAEAANHPCHAIEQLNIEQLNIEHPLQGNWVKLGGQFNTTAFGRSQSDAS